MKKTMIALLSITLLFASFSSAFAGEEDKLEPAPVQSTRMMEMINENINEENNEHIITGEDVDIVVSKNAEDGIKVKDNNIKDGYQINLGEAFYGSNARLVNKEGINFVSNSGNSQIAIAALFLECENIVYDEIQISATIYKKEGIEELEVFYDIPEGYYLKTDYDLCKHDDNCCGQLFVVKENGETCLSIEPLVAIDSNGTMLDACYSVCDKRVTFSLDERENISYPVLITSTSHPDKTTTVMINRTAAIQVKSRIQAQINDASNQQDLVFWIADYVYGETFPAMYSIAIYSIGALSWLAADGYINKLIARRDMYSTKINNMISSDGLNVTSVRKWQHHGSNDGTYRLYNETLAIVHH